METRMPEVFVAKLAEFPDGERKIVQSGAHDIGVFHWEGEFYAYSNLCLHQGGPACEGLIMHQVEDVIGPDKTWVGQKFSDSQINFVCPWHGYEYDLKTGECVPDRKLRLKKYNVVRRGDDIYVAI
jgi:nitrite reductase/ring-hydroxylating ferredoxin subunit